MQFKSMNKSIATSIAIALLCALTIAQLISTSQAKLLSSRQRFFDEPYANTPYGSMATGERAVITVRGTRNPYDGRAPARLTIEDDPYRGPLPRGIYDRLDYAGGRMPYGGVGYPMGGQRYPMNNYYNQQP